MRWYATYRRNIAAILLLLYAFAASPVQFWHRHTGPGQNVQAAIAPVIPKNTPDNLTIAKAAIATDKCSICLHQHAVFTWDEPGADTVMELSSDPVISSRKEPLLQVAHFLLSNKSPPAMA